MSVHTLSRHIPPGPVSLPGTGRTVWWTGRVAIGLRHEARGPVVGVHAEQIQRVLLAKPTEAPATRLQRAALAVGAAAAAYALTTSVVLGR